jgi:hypothetical protein
MRRFLFGACVLLAFAACADDYEEGAPLDQIESSAPPLPGSSISTAPGLLM